jgi:hypothetical protein
MTKQMIPRIQLQVVIRDNIGKPYTNCDSTKKFPSYFPTKLLIEQTEYRIHDCWSMRLSFPKIFSGFSFFEQENLSEFSDDFNY